MLSVMFVWYRELSHDFRIIIKWDKSQFEPKQQMVYLDLMLQVQMNISTIPSLSIATCSAVVPIPWPQSFPGETRSSGCLKNVVCVYF